jgi:hypothetical protein
MDTQSYEAPLDSAPTSRKQATPPDRRIDAPRDMEQRPGLRSVAVRWPQLSPAQTRQLYDLVYRRAPRHLRLPVPPARGGQIRRGAPWSRVACGFPLLWAVRAEQRYARRHATRKVPAAQAA